MRSRKLGEEAGCPSAWPRRGCRLGTSLHRQLTPACVSLGACRSCLRSWMGWSSARGPSWSRVGGGWWVEGGGGVGCSGGGVCVYVCVCGWGGWGGWGGTHGCMVCRSRSRQVRTPSLMPFHAGSRSAVDRPPPRSAGRGQAAALLTWGPTHARSPSRSSDSWPNCRDGRSEQT